MKRKRKNRRTIFFALFSIYAVFAGGCLWLLADSIDEKILQLLLVGLFPVVMVSCCLGWIREGEVELQGIWSVETSSKTGRIITRKDNPWSFWCGIGMTLVFALAIEGAVFLGVYLRWMDSR
ncbi:hypothetical protein [Desulfatirhabdium butyrativorans]|uniref:hypothetical protein n=1 Tax=Desulfatirhabdium butyrativorans TaxID=340467 RepID=UPI00048006F1|nr:hypothetical protein [Desulfatirhabdium butyrativorans]